MRQGDKGPLALGTFGGHEPRNEYPAPFIGRNLRPPLSAPRPHSIALGRQYRARPRRRRRDSAPHARLPPVVHRGGDHPSDRLAAHQAGLAGHQGERSTPAVPVGHRHRRLQHTRLLGPQLHDGTQHPAAAVDRSADRRALELRAFSRAPDPWPALWYPHLAHWRGDHHLPRRLRPSFVADVQCRRSDEISSPCRSTASTPCCCARGRAWTMSASWRSRSPAAR